MYELIDALEMERERQRTIIINTKDRTATTFPITADDNMPATQVRLGRKSWQTIPPEIHEVGKWV